MCAVFLKCGILRIFLRCISLEVVVCIHCLQIVLYLQYPWLSFFQTRLMIRFHTKKYISHLIHVEQEEYSIYGMDLNFTYLIYIYNMMYMIYDIHKYFKVKIRTFTLLYMLSWCIFYFRESSLSWTGLPRNEKFINLKCSFIDLILLCTTCVMWLKISDIVLMHVTELVLLKVTMD